MQPYLMLELRIGWAQFESKLNLKLQNNKTYQKFFIIKLSVTQTLVHGN